MEMTLHRIGRFEVINLLGQGGHAKVYLVRDPEDGTQKAAKILRRDVDEDYIHSIREGIINEKRVSDELFHNTSYNPAIEGGYMMGAEEAKRYFAPIEEVLEEAGRPVIIMEYVPERLDSWIRKEHGTEERLKILCDIAIGLQHLHQHQFVHRDIKLENILLSEERAKILDLGITKKAGTRSGGAGAPIYMPPELLDYRKIEGKYQVISLEQANPIRQSHDVYSFGILMWEVLAKQHPFSASTGQEILLNMIDIRNYVDNGMHSRLDKILSANKINDLPRRVRKAMIESISYSPLERQDMQSVLKKLVGGYNKFAAAPPAQKTFFSIIVDAISNFTSAPPKVPSCNLQDASEHNQIDPKNTGVELHEDKTNEALEAAEQGRRIMEKFSKPSPEEIAIQESKEELERARKKMEKAKEESRKLAEKYKLKN